MKRKLFSFLVILLFSIPISLVAQEKNLGPILGKILKFSSQKGTQSPDFMIDNISSTTTPKATESQKWCVELFEEPLPDSWVVIDLGLECEITKFVIHDGPSIEGLNQWVQPFEKYAIYVSSEFDPSKGESEHFGMTEIIKRDGDLTDDEKLVRTDELATPTKARYIQLKVFATKVIRIFEFEIWGKAPSLIIDPVGLQKITDNNNNPTVEVSYQTSGAVASDFKHNVTAKNGKVKIDKITNNPTEKKLSFLISSDEVFASDSITVEITNDATTLTRTFPVKIATTNSTDFVNVAKNKKALVAYSERVLDSITNKLSDKWHTEETTLITDNDITSSFENDPARHDSQIRVVLDDKYIISAVRYIYEPTLLEGDKAFGTAGLHISKEDLKNTWLNSELLKYSNENFPGAALYEKKDEFAIFPTPMEAFLVQIENVFDNSGVDKNTKRKMALYETMVYCEKPVLGEVTNTVSTEQNPIKLSIDLKGFKKINKENIKIEVIPTNTEVKADNITLSEDRTEISFFLNSSKAVTGNTEVEVKVSNLKKEFDLSQKFSATAMFVTPSSIKQTANEAEIKVWPSIITDGATLNIFAPTAEYARILSLAGSNVINQQLANEAPTQIETADLKPGIYLLQLLNKQGKLIKTSKIVIK